MRRRGGGRENTTGINNAGMAYGRWLGPKYSISPCAKATDLSVIPPFP